MGSRGKSSPFRLSWPHLWRFSPEYPLKILKVSTWTIEVKENSWKILETARFRCKNIVLMDFEDLQGILHVRYSRRRLSRKQENEFASWIYGFSHRWSWSQLTLPSSHRRTLQCPAQPLLVCLALGLVKTWQSHIWRVEDSYFFPRLFRFEPKGFQGLDTINCYPSPPGYQGLLPWSMCITVEYIELYMIWYDMILYDMIWYDIYI